MHRSTVRAGVAIPAETGELLPYDRAVPRDLTIVVITHNSEAVVGDLLDSIPAALDELTAEVVVVDNASSDATVAVVSGRGDCKVVEARNDGYAAGFNLGVASSTATEALLVLNPDVRLQPCAVRRLWEALSAPEVGVAAPLVRDEDGALVPSLRREPSLGRALGLSRTGLDLLSEYVSGPEHYSVSHDVDWALGAVLLVSRQCYEAVGGWDPSYFLYSEETDFCLRARDLGYRTRFVPDAVVTHIGGGSGRSPWTHTLQIVNRVRLYGRRHRTPATVLYYGLTVLSELTWVLRGHRDDSMASVTALLVPRRRPSELGCSDRLLPR